MEKNEKLNTQTPYETESTKSLQELNLLDDFLFDVATEDLEAKEHIPSADAHFQDAGNQRGNCRAPHPHGGKAQLAENQDIV